MSFENNVSNFWRRFKPRLEMFWKITFNRGFKCLKRTTGPFMLLNFRVLCWPALFWSQGDDDGHSARIKSQNKIHFSDEKKTNKLYCRGTGDVTDEEKLESFLMVLEALESERCPELIIAEVDIEGNRVWGNLESRSQNGKDPFTFKRWGGSSGWRMCQRPMWALRV